MPRLISERRTEIKLRLPVIAPQLCEIKARLIGMRLKRWLICESRAATELRLGVTERLWTVIRLRQIVTSSRRRLISEPPVKIMLAHRATAPRIQIRLLPKQWTPISERVIARWLLPTAIGRLWTVGRQRQIVIAPKWRLSSEPPTDRTRSPIVSARPLTAASPQLIVLTL